MKQRVMTGLLGAFIFLFFLYMGKGWYTAFLLFIAVTAYIEFVRIKFKRWNQPGVWLGLTLVFLFFFSDWPPILLPSSGLFFTYPENILIGFILFSFIVIWSGNRFSWKEAAYLFIGAIYIGISFSIMAKTIWKYNGFLVTLFILLITWANDTGAYFAGKQFGKRKLVPRISPSKTVEGAIGGMLSSVFLSGFFFAFVPHLWEGWVVLVLGLFISILGQLGDLIESAWKRSQGVKDSGILLPGHGGVLDRFDSLLFIFVFLFSIHLI